MVKVLAVTNDYPTDERPGQAPCIRDQVHALRDAGHTVDLLLITPGRTGSYVQAALKLIAQGLQSRRYDILHAYYGHCGLIARLQWRYPIVVTFRGSDLLSAKDGPIGGLAARWADGVIVMSEEMRHVSRRPDAVVIPFGVNTDIFQPRARDRAREALGLPQEEDLILFPYNPRRREKRFDLIEGAVHLIQATRPRATLITVFDQPHASVATYMNACDALVLASDHEGSPMAVREAMACNLPVVAVDVGDVRRIIGDTDGCHLCEQEVDDIAEKLGWVLDRGVRTKGASTIERVSAAGAAAEVAAVYDRVLTHAAAKTRSPARL